jgi:hypothetical protein
MLGNLQRVGTIEAVRYVLQITFLCSGGFDCRLKASFFDWLLPSPFSVQTK